MARKASSQPTEVELDILRVLWERGPSSVRQVHDALVPSRNVGYSTTLKMMQVMFEKSLILRDESQRPQIYRAAQEEAKTKRMFVDDLIQRVFGGSVRKLVLSAMESPNISSEEIAEIKKEIKLRNKK